MNKKAAPYGSWKSPLTADQIVSESVGIGSISFSNENIYWQELHFHEEGRTGIMRLCPNGCLSDILPRQFDASTRVHEYGGRSFVVENDTIYFSNGNDQRLYKMEPESMPVPLTPKGDMRFADYTIDNSRNFVFCVREDHTIKNKPVNTLVKIRIDSGECEGEIVVSGNDFYSSPRISPDGTQLAWITWNHPHMPWDQTELWTGVLDKNGMISQKTLIAGGEIEESVMQPQWSPDGILFFVSDRSNWWNLYRYKDNKIEPLCSMPAEFGLAPWTLGMSTYVFESLESIICSFVQRGKSYLARLDLVNSELCDIDVPFTCIDDITLIPGKVLMIAGSPTQRTAIIKYDLMTKEINILRPSSTIHIHSGYTSIPEEIEFPTQDNRSAFGFFYFPHNQDFRAPDGEKPPLLVMSHSGPTSAASPIYNDLIQYWTSRGIAVLDVNYSGSTGYGRDYRKRLYGKWGIIDVNDCISGAIWLAERGEIDESRLMMTGGSASGFTTLCALTFYNIFKAGAVHFGVGDLELLVKRMHKFESRYMEKLIGPYPAERIVYINRSPINFLDRLSSPIIIFQGAQDTIVPPNQSRNIFETVKNKGIPVVYLEFEEEGHGFRIGKNIKRTLEAELYFYSRVLGFELPDSIESIEIHNLRS